ncbi:hypothetical protein E3N88_21278 [Mikania micrantha]|uniref:Uncharacterized protein n=1 Tax=Mikania micrantha TaxID=192012 RepID=A0A5N6NLV1_9ASTR|nr:hypothetical protein E3N88_21278 [Mikania micrantha]
MEVERRSRQEIEEEIRKERHERLELQQQMKEFMKKFMQRSSRPVQVMLQPAFQQHHHLRLDHLNQQGKHLIHWVCCYHHLLSAQKNLPSLEDSKFTPPARLGTVLTGDGAKPNAMLPSDDGEYFLGRPLFFLAG